MKNHLRKEIETAETKLKFARDNLDKIEDPVELRKICVVLINEFRIVLKAMKRF